MRPLLVFCALAVACTRLSVTTSAAPSHAALRHTIDSLLSDPAIRGSRWGVLIVDPDGGDTLYSRDAGKLFVPASNLKIVTAAVALDALGPDFRFETTIVARGDIQSGVLDGDLLVVGRGDPTVSDHMAGDAMIPLRAIADSLATRGIQGIRGRVVAYGNAFPDATAGFAWSWDDFDYPYGARTDELTFNEGFARVRVLAGARPGDEVRVQTLPARTVPHVRVEALTIAPLAADTSPRLAVRKDTARGDMVVSGAIAAGDSADFDVTFMDPARAYVAALREALRDRGIPVADSTLTERPRLETLYVHRSPPLREVLAAMMKPSQNQIAEMVFKTIGLQVADTGSARVASRVVTARLAAWGAAPGGFLIWDGSGLSRRDLISPETIVRVLLAMNRSPHATTFYDTFPVAGVDGTMRTRLRSTAGDANARAKTGTMGNIRALSGYVTAADGRRLAFSIIANNHVVSTDYVSRIQDAIVSSVARTATGSRR